MRCLFALCLAVALPSAARADDLVGHYYLQGVFETGSELLLSADGRYQWFLSYGALDQQSTGRWVRSGDTVTLTATLPAADAPLFRFTGIAPWDVSATLALKDREIGRAGEAAVLRCPFLAGEADAAAAARMAVDEPEITPQTAPAAAPVALKAAEVARQAAEAALATFVQAPPRSANWQAASDKARDALGVYRARRFRAQDLYAEASLPMPDLPEIAPPALCQVPGDAETFPDPAPQIAVRVRDADRQFGLQDARIRFTYGDGTVAQDVTGEGGWAFASLPKAAPLIRIALHRDKQGGDNLAGADAEFDVMLARDGIVTLGFDVTRLIAPAFTTLVLTIDKGALVPREWGRGRYTK